MVGIDGPRSMQPTAACHDKTRPGGAHTYSLEWEGEKQLGVSHDEKQA